MKKMLILLSHQLTDAQKEDLQNMCYEPVFMTESEKAIWSQITPETLTEDVEAILNAHQFDDCVAQGHMGAVAHVLKTVGFNHCYYAHTVRDGVVEVKRADGTVVKTTNFKHVKFLQY